MSDTLSKVGDTVADGLKGANAACSAAILLAAIMAVLVYFSIKDEQARTHEREQTNRALMLEALEECPLPDDRAKAERVPP